MKPFGSERVYYPSLDSLRGIACLLVVFTHNFGFTKFFFFGWLSVDLFFVISGFLITEVLLITKDRRNFIGNFYLKRFLRVVPLYYLVLAFFFFIAPLIKNFPLDLSDYIANQWWFWAFLQNWFLIFHNFGHTTSVIWHFWSLGVEEQFYILWPWVILLLKKPKYLLIFSGMLLLAVIATRFTLWTYHIQDLNYFGLYTFTRIDGICIGSMLALLKYIHSDFLRKYDSIVVLTLAGFNFLFFFLNRQNDNTLPYLAIVGYTTFAVMIAMLVFETIREENKIINFVLSFSFLRFIGKISFSFYVLHWPVYQVFYGYTSGRIRKNFQITEHTVQMATSIILTLAGLIVSIFFYYFFEKQFLKLKKKISY